MNATTNNSTFSITSVLLAILTFTFTLFLIQSEMPLSVQVYCLSMILEPIFVLVVASCAIATVMEEVNPSSNAAKYETRRRHFSVSTVVCVIFFVLKIVLGNHLPAELADLSDSEILKIAFSSTALR